MLAAVFNVPPEAAQDSTILHFQFPPFNLHTDGSPCFYVLFVTKIACKSLYIVTFFNFELKQKYVIMGFYCNCNHCKGTAVAQWLRR